MVCIRKNNLPELLAPAGSFEHLTAAIKAGADAVYLGGHMFGARAYAGNFGEDELIEAIRYAHLYNRKIYMTVNTLLKDQELEEQLFDYMKPYYEAGLDGVIVQDIGVAAYLREAFPDLELHGSTQMTLTSVEGAIAAKRMGMNRIVPARELSLLELSEMKKESGLEIEVFIHGALCYCYSGQCLLSSVYGGRSGNRGRCAQPCRLPYAIDGSSRHYLSPKDLCALRILPDLISAGVDSLKIEGRMKNPEYVAGVVSIYRKYLDWCAGADDLSLYRVDQDDINTLEELFSRSGFTDGYYKKHNGPEMMSILQPNHMGRCIGTLQRINKNRISVRLSATIHAKDILVLTEDIVLTVPAGLDGVKAGNTVWLNTPGYRNLTPGMPVYRRRNEEISSRIETDILQKKLKLPVTMHMQIQNEKESVLRLSSGEFSITVHGLPAQKATGHPVSESDIKKQLCKTGESVFTVAELFLDLEDGLFIPMSVIKKMRQEGCSLLETAVKSGNTHNRKAAIRPKHLPYKISCDIVVPASILIVVWNYEIFEACLCNTQVNGIVIPCEFFAPSDWESMHKRIKAAGKKSYLSLPRVFRKNSFIRENSLLGIFDGIYVWQINEAQWIHILAGEGVFSPQTEMIIGNSLYMWNDRSKKELSGLFGDCNMSLIYDAPLEFDMNEWMDGNYYDTTDECLIYGNYPVMSSAQCVNMTRNRCTGKPDTLFMTDTKNRVLPVTTHCRDCYNLIWKDKPRDWLSDGRRPDRLPGRIRIDTFGLSMQEVERVLTLINKISQGR